MPQRTPEGLRLLRPAASPAGPIDPALLNVPGMPFSARERWSLAGLYGCIALLHLAGAAALLYYRAGHPSLVGLGVAAYLFGLRHAFDADHIAAIDDTVRFMLQQGRRPLGVGFFFSLGHSTIVLALAVAAVLAAAAVKADLPLLQGLGAIVGTGVSGLFLWVVGILNLQVLLQMLNLWRRMQADQHGHLHLEQLLARRGFLNRLFGSRLRFISRSWQMYPLGLLFGLGFDTASEISLLAMTAGAAAGNLPLPAALSLPVLFAAGMSLMDTTDGVLMTKAYNWAFINPVRKIFYNLATTSLSVAVALGVGSIELLQVCVGLFGLRGGFFGRVAGLDFGSLGYVVVGLFLASWALSVVLWKFGGLNPLPARSAVLPVSDPAPGAGGVAAGSPPAPGRGRIPGIR